MSKLQRYQLFGYDTYYPGGGSGDVLAEGDTIAELVEAYDLQKWRSKRDTYEILDMQERRWLDEAEANAVINLFQPRS